MTKRILAICKNEMITVDNEDGTRTVIDLKNNVSARVRDGVYIPFGSERVDPDTCQHPNAYRLSIRPDETEAHCPDCGSTIDEYGELVIRGDAEPEF